LPSNPRRTSGAPTLAAWNARHIRLFPSRSVCALKTLPEDRCAKSVFVSHELRTKISLACQVVDINSSECVGLAGVSTKPVKFGVLEFN
jgi:hypothetical protein